MVPRQSQKSGKIRRRSPDPIGESFNGASLSKIVSYGDRARSSVFGEFEHGENGDRERMAWLAFANPATRSPELFPTAATCLPATIIATIRCETPKETLALVYATETAEGKKQEAD